MMNGMPIQYLNGIDDYNTNDFAGLLGLDGSEADERKLYDFLVEARKSILANPTSVETYQNPADMLKMIDYAIKYWDTPQRQRAVDILIAQEEKLIKKGAILSGFDDNNQPLEGLFSKIGSALKKVGSKITSGVKSVVRNVGDRAKAAIVTAIPASSKVFDVAKALVNKPSSSDSSASTDEQAQPQEQVQERPFFQKVFDASANANANANTNTNTNTSNKMPNTMENPNPGFVEKYFTPKNIIIGGILLVGTIVGYKMLTKKKAIVSATPAALSGVRRRKKKVVRRPTKGVTRKANGRTGKVKSVRVR